MTGLVREFVAVAMLIYCPALLTGAAGSAGTGVALYRERRFAEAERALRATLNAQPRDETIRLYLARTLVELQRHPEALTVLEPLTAPTASPEARLEAGRLLRRLAERRFAKLQRVAGGTAATLEIAGRRLEREGKLPAALEQYRAVQRLEPDRPGIHYALGSVLWKMRELPAAEQELNAELAKQPSHGMANLRLGQVLLTTNRETEAVPYLERAQAALPHLAEIRRELGKAYRKAGRPHDARVAWEAAAQATPNDDQIHYLLAGLYRELGEADLARRELQRHREILAQKRQQ